MNAIIEKAKLSRKAVLQSKTNRADGVLADPPPAPTFPAQTIPGDKRIPIVHLDKELDYLIRKPLLEDEDDAIQPQIRKKDTTTWIDILPGQFLELGPVADRDWTQPFKIAQSFLKEDPTPEEPTEWFFRYIFYAGGTNDVASLESSFAIDRTRYNVVKTPPSDRTPGAPTWPADLGPLDPIDEAYLEGKSGIVVKPFIAANYMANDVFAWFFGPSPDPGRDTPVLVGSLSANQDAEIPAAVFINAGDGPNRLIYVNTDAAGNVARTSNFSQRNVVHKPDPDPGTVKPPIVTLANGDNGDNLIDREDMLFDARGVEIVVEVPTPNSPADTIVVTLHNEQVGTEQRIGAATELKFYAPRALVEQIYGNTDGIVQRTVAFKMFRGLKELATDKVDIDIDISFVGGTLPAPSLRTTAGSDNEILESDYGDDGIQASLAMPATPPTEEGWLLDFIFGIETFATVPLTAGQAGTTISEKLPWSVVEALGGGSTHVLRCELYVPGGTNRNKSGNQDIPVEPFPIQMDAPEILHLAGPVRRIGCPTLNFPTATNPGDGTPRRNLLVRVLPNAFTVNGEEITLKYIAYPKDDASTPIPGTDAEATFQISGTFPTDGIVIGIGDYEEDFKPAHQALGHVWYVISRGGPGQNLTPDSAVAIRELDLDDSEGRFCEEFVPTP
ncbi:hypothetical protein N8H71_03225 [Pseudomonas koreensis]|uniref:hypothetical protein n=1 Tax=Pseudomonas koreensis TaxID=198620 RepID=UPI0021CA9A43|nr:hypothetical protein [Pseudomonas koreensis]MCU0070584.1 hypothetical protein [Pseudomonas koreensis]